MSQSDGSGCTFLVFGAIAFYVFAPVAWINSVWYAIEYRVGLDKVETETRPKDCDFMHAPIGDKGCSYTYHVHAYNSAGVLIDGENAPRYSRDSSTGKTIISYDNGKTWEWWGFNNLPDKRIETVKVTWSKE